MRKFLAVICLTAFIALQYGKVISYWQCRLVATTADCGCDKKLAEQHTDKDHPSPLTIAKEKAQEVFMVHSHISTLPPVPLTTQQQHSNYQPYHPVHHACPVFQPPRA